jgi:hypothetical protein
MTMGVTVGRRRCPTPCQEDVARIQEEESWDCVARKVLHAVLGHDQRAAAALWRAPPTGVARAITLGQAGDHPPNGKEQDPWQSAYNGIASGENGDGEENDKEVQYSLCENINLWISLSGDLVFSHQQGIYGFKFPKKVFKDLFQRSHFFSSSANLKT